MSQCNHLQFNLILLNLLIYGKLMRIPFSHPASILIAGPSRSGKTVFVRRMLSEKMISPFPSRVVIVYGEWQKEYEKVKQMFPDVEFIKGPLPPNLYESFDAKENNMLVLDDQMAEAGKSSQLEKYFVQGSHHRNLTVVFIVQNIFDKGKVMRTTNLNSNYLVLYKNPRDKGQIGVLGRQMYPAQWREFLAAFQNATESPYSYLLVDLMPGTPDEYRLRSHIFPSDEAGSTDIYLI